jgi:hypothetical protein
MTGLRSKPAAFKWKAAACGVRQLRPLRLRVALGKFREKEKKITQRRRAAGGGAESGVSGVRARFAVGEHSAD